MNRLSEATESLRWPQTEVWGFATITALRAVKVVRFSERGKWW